MDSQLINIFKVLGSEKKLKVFKKLIILVAAIFFDILSIGLILPILTLFFDENRFENYEILVSAKEYFDFDVNLILFSVVIFFFCYTCKSNFITFF